MLLEGKVKPKETEAGVAAYQVTLLIDGIASTKLSIGFERKD